MPVTQPAEVVGGRAVQMIVVDSPPTAPYTLRATFAVPVGTLTGSNRFGVRHMKEPVSTGWFQTQAEHMARTKTHDYYEVFANVTSGTETRFVVDVVDGDVDLNFVTYDHGGASVTKRYRNAISADAWELVNFGHQFGGGLSLDLSTTVRGGGSVRLSDRAFLTGFGVPFSGTSPTLDSPQRDRMWTQPRQNIGNHRFGGVCRTLYKHIPMKAGGNSGYLHIWATVFANSPEVQFIVNWHNGVIEERREVPGSGAGGVTVEDPSGAELESPPGGFGVARMVDVLFTRLQINGFLGLPEATPNITFSGATYTDASKRITKTGAFTNYTHRAGNRVLINAGADATLGDYEIARKVSADAIELVTSIGSAADADTDIGGHVIPYWTMTPELMDTSVTPNLSADPCIYQVAGAGGVGSNVQVLVQAISQTDLNRLHPLLVTNERSFRFAIHPSTVTPYQKLVTGRSDWSRGGWGFSPLGAPDYDAVNSTAVGMDLTAEASTAKSRLRQLLPYKLDGTQSEGMLPPGAFCPNSYGAYGGETGGIGILPEYGIKSSWDARKAAIDILKVEQLRVQSRHYGCLYYNFTGMPVNPWLHSQRGTNAQWRRADRRFLRNGTSPADAPFSISVLRNPRARALTILDADYNPGPRGRLENTEFTPTDAQGFVPSTSVLESSVPDWWVWGEDDNGDGVGDGVAGDLFVADYFLPLRNTSAPAPTALGTFVDFSVPVEIQIQGASAFNNTKSVTFRITGIGALDVAATEDVVVTGPASGAPSLQTYRSAGEFKSISSIMVVSVTGTLLSTERFRFGRGAVDIPDYFGDLGGILAIDSQHQVRQTTPNLALFLLENDPLAKLYLWMNAMDQRMQYWEGGGQAHRLDPTERAGTGRGSNSTREHAWASNTMATWAAIAAAHFRVSESAAGPINLLYGNTTESFGLAQWIGVMGSRFINGKMTNGANASYYNKNSEKAPTGLSNGPSVNGEAFYIIAPREQSFLSIGLHNLSNVWLPTAYSGVSQTLTQVEDMLLEQQTSFLNFMSKRSGGATGLYHTYVPCATRKAGISASGLTWNETQRTLTRTGAFTNYSFAPDDTATIISGTGATKGPFLVESKLNNNSIVLSTSIGAGAGSDIVANVGKYVPVSSLADNVGVWEVYGPAQEDLPEWNPITGLAINPATYPTIATGRFAAAVTGDSAQMNSGSIGSGTAFTIANASGDANYATGALIGAPIPTPVRLTISDPSQTYTSAKKRTFRITGTGFVTGGSNLNVGVISEDLFVQGKSGTSKAYQTRKHFITVTSIQMIAASTDAGSTVVGETFAFGTANVGLRLNPSERVGGQLIAGLEDALTGEAQGFHLAGPLGVQKYLAEQRAASSSDVDTMIQRWTGTASEALALAALQGYAEYGGSNPAERIEHCSWLFWQLGMNTQSVAPAADFGKTADSGATSVKVGFWAKAIGRIATYEWSWDNGSSYTDTGKYVQHTFLTGTHNVKLRVTDTDGTQHVSAAQTITVS